MRLILAIFCVWILVDSIFSQETQREPAIGINKFSAPPMIDGIQDEVWKEASVIPALTQFEPKEGIPMTENTEVRIGYDDNYFYALFVASDSSPELIRANLTPREQALIDDQVAVILDTFGDKRRAYEFFSNPLGVQTDMMNSNGNEDPAPDFVWYSKGKLTNSGYLVEMKIPLKSLRFKNGIVQPWKIMVCRTIPRKNEKGTWPVYYRQTGAMLSQTGNVTGLNISGSSGKMDIIPEFTAFNTNIDEKSGNSAHYGQTNMRLGATIKYGLTPAWTASAALNPDFSQVEADDPQMSVNQRYALYYPEKRPFFMEDIDIFSTPINVAHTRTIADPGYGMKLTGKQDAFTLGVLASEDREGGGAMVHIARAKIDIGKESALGVVYSGRENFGAGYNRVGGADGSLRLGKTYGFDFQALTSYTSAADKLTTAPAFYGNFWKSSRDFDFTLNYTDINPEFRTDNGYIQYSDMRYAYTSASYKFWQKNGLMQYWQLNAQGWLEYNYAGIRMYEGAEAGGKVMFPGNTSISLAYTPDSMERYAGVSFRIKTFSFTLNSEPSRYLAASASYEGGDGIYYDVGAPYSGKKNNWNFSLKLMPVSRLQITQVFLNSRFDNRSDERVFSENIWQTKIGLQWTKELSSRVLYQYATLAHEGYANILLSWVLVPGTAAHLGYNMNFNGQKACLDKTSEIIFTKISYLFRL